MMDTDEEEIWGNGDGVLQEDSNNTLVEAC